MKNGNIITRSSLLSEFSEDKIVRCVVHTVLYVCTCLCATICADALIITTICKHIHLVFRFNFKDSKTVDGHNETSLNQTMDLQDDVTSPVEDIQVHDPSVKQPYLRTYKKHHKLKVVLEITRIFWDMSILRILVA